MLRTSAVLWTHAGETYPGLRDEYRSWLDEEGVRPDAKLMIEKREQLSTIARMLFKKSADGKRATRSSVTTYSTHKDLDHEQQDMIDLTGALALQLRLRLRGGAKGRSARGLGKRKRKGGTCKKKNS